MAPKTIICLLEMYMKAKLAKISLQGEGILYLSFRCSDHLRCVQMSSTLEKQVTYSSIQYITFNSF